MYVGLSRRADCDESKSGLKEGIVLDDRGEIERGRPREGTVSGRVGPLRAFESGDVPVDGAVIGRFSQLEAERTPRPLRACPSWSR